jgi:hypothetical protein
MDFAPPLSPKPSPVSVVIGKAAVPEPQAPTTAAAAATTTTTTTTTTATKKKKSEANTKKANIARSLGNPEDRVHRSRQQEVAKAQLQTENRLVQTDVNNSLDDAALRQFVRAQREVIILQVALEGPEAALITLMGSKPTEPLPLSVQAEVLDLFRQAVKAFVANSEKVRLRGNTRSLLSQSVAHVMQDYYDQLGSYNAMQSGSGHADDPALFVTAPRQRNVPADFKLAMMQVLHSSGRLPPIHYMPVVDQVEHQRLRELECVERFAFSKDSDRSKHGEGIRKAFHNAARGILAGSVRKEAEEAKEPVGSMEAFTRFLSPDFVKSARFHAWKEAGALTRWNLRKLASHIQQTLLTERQCDLKTEKRRAKQAAAETPEQRAARAAKKPKKAD